VPTPHRHSPIAFQDGHLTGTVKKQQLPSTRSICARHRICGRGADVTLRLWRSSSPGSPRRNPPPASTSWAVAALPVVAEMEPRRDRASTARNWRACRAEVAAPTAIPRNRDPPARWPALHHRSPSSWATSCRNRMGPEMAAAGQVGRPILYRRLRTGARLAAEGNVIYLRARARRAPAHQAALAYPRR